MIILPNLPNLPNSPASPFPSTSAPLAAEYLRELSAVEETQVREVELPVSFEIFPVGEKTLTCSGSQFQTQPRMIQPIQPQVQPYTQPQMPIQDYPPMGDWIESEVQAANFELEIPDFENQELGNPAFTNPELATPAFANPAFTDSTFTNPAFTDSTFTDSTFTDSTFTDSTFTDSTFTDSAFTDSAFTNPGQTIPDLVPLGVENDGSLAPLWGSEWGMNDVPPVVIFNSYDDDDEDDDMDDVADEEDDDVYEEVEMFDDFDDDFDEDFEDEFDEDYEDLAKIDDEELDGDEDEGNAVPSRYEEEFGDVDGQAKFIPDGADIGLPEEVLIGEEDLDVNVGSDFDDFDDDEENGVFN